MHDDVDVQFTGKALEFAFPQPHPRAIAAAAIRSDGQPLGVRIENFSRPLLTFGDRCARRQNARRYYRPFASAYTTTIFCSSYNLAPGSTNSRAICSSLSMTP